MTRAEMDPERWARVKEVFHDALELDGSERGSFLARVCGSDDGLRNEVERLLTAHAEAGGFIEPASADVTGRRLGRYELRRLLGSGGMGEVYLASDLELGRDVALKLAISSDDDARLLREAKHASRLNHPRICTIHEVGTCDRRIYMAMEYVEGQRLSDLISGTGLPTSLVVDYGTQIADALAHAHQRGVVHRDLKGANVIITPDGRIKLLDFGLARPLPPARLKELSEKGATVTSDGLLAGTLSFMAPELLRGAQADARSDIWSLGVLLHEMAAGTQPFTGATGFELSAAILREPPAALPVHVPGPLQEIIQRCLQKDPAERYQEASELRAALEALQAGVSAPASSLLSSAPWARYLSRRLAGTLAGLLIAFTGAATLWRVLNAPETPLAGGTAGRPVMAIMTFDNLAGQEMSWLSKGVQSMLLTGLAQTRGLAIISPQRLHEVVRDMGGSSLESFDRAQASDVARRAGAGVAVVGSIMRAGAAIRIDAQVEDLSSGRVLAATSVNGTDLFVLVDQLAARIRGSVGLGEALGLRPIVEVSSASLEAYRLYSQGVDAFVNMRLDSAQDLLEQAVVLDPTFAEAYLQLALLSGPARRPAERIGFLRQAARYRDRLSEPRRLLMEIEFARDEGRFNDAASGLTELVSLFPDLDAAATLAWQLHAPTVGPLPDADRLLAITSEVTSANPSSTLARNTHGYALLNVGRFDDAMREFEAYAQLSPREPNPYDGLGDAYLMRGLPEKAIEPYSRALTIDPTFASGGRAWTLAVLGRYEEALLERASPPHLKAVSLARVGRYREAGEIVAEAARTAERGGDLAGLAGLHLLSALFALERGGYRAALAETRLANDVLMKLPEERRRFSFALCDLIAGVAELRNGRPAAARAHLESQRRSYPTTVRADQWWHNALEGEIALVEGDLDHAAAAFSRGEPSRKVFVKTLVEGSVVANDLVFRDGPARVAKARGDVRGAVAIYRRLLTYGPEQKWVAVFEPRYVLETARLLEQAGDTSAARAEYERFLQFWKGADAGLPEPIEARRALARLASDRP